MYLIKLIIFFNYFLSFLSGNSQKRRLDDFCPTRWVEKVTELDGFKDLYATTVIFLDEVSLNMELVCNQHTKLPHCLK